VFDVQSGEFRGVVLSNNNEAVDSDLTNLRPGEFLAIAQNPNDTWSWAAVTANGTTGMPVAAPQTEPGMNGVRATGMGLRNVPGGLGVTAEAPVRDGAFAFERRATNAVTLTTDGNSFPGGLGRNGVTLTAAGTLHVPNHNTVLDRRRNPGTSAVPNSVLIDANTQIIVFGPSTTPLAGWITPTTSPVTPTIHWTASRMTRANLIANQRILDNAYRIAVVTGGNPSNPAHAYRHPNVAEVVFISTTAGLNEAIGAELPDFGVITQVTPNTPSAQSLGTVLVVGEAPRLVASTEALQVGQLVRFTNSNAAFTAPGETAARPLVAVVDGQAVPFVTPGDVSRVPTNAARPFTSTNPQADIAANTSGDLHHIIVATGVGTPTRLDDREIATVAGRTINRAAGRVMNYTNHGGHVLIDVATTTGTGSFTVPAGNLAQLNIDMRRTQSWSTDNRMRVPLMGTGSAPGTNYVNSVLGARNVAANGNFNAYGYYRGEANAIVWYDALTAQPLAVILVRTRIQGGDAQGETSYHNPRYRPNR
jgi:hypothetical protein